jgi:hypothetical protein
MSLQPGQSPSKAAVVISPCPASSGFDPTSDLDVSGPCELADKIVLLGIERELRNRARQNTANAMRLIFPDGDPDILHDHLFIVRELMRLVFRFHMGNLRVPDVTLNRLKRLRRGNSTHNRGNPARIQLAAPELGRSSWGGTEALQPPPGPVPAHVILGQLGPTAGTQFHSWRCCFSRGARRREPGSALRYTFLVPGPSG